MRCLLAVLLNAAVLVGPVGAKDGLGISSWAGWSPGQVSRAQCPELHSVPLILRWSRLEHAPGEYAFATEIGKRLKAAHDG